MKKRLFIAVDISDEVRHAAGRYIQEISNRFAHVRAKWAAAETLHLTLKFLGSVEADLIAPLTEILDRVSTDTRPFEVTISGAGVFPSASRPRVIWLGVNDASGEMSDLARRLDIQMAELGFELEKREFKPHLTLARIRDPRMAADLGRAHCASDFGPIRFSSGESVIYESHLGRAGSWYEKLHTAKFRG